MGEAVVVVEDRGDEFEPEVEPVPEVAVDPADVEAIAGVVGVEAVVAVTAVAPDADVAATEEDATTDQIPKARFDEVNDKRKQAEDENRALKEQLATKETPVVTEDPSADATVVHEPGSVGALEQELDEITTKAQESLLDGELEENARLVREANKLNRQIAKEEMRAENQEAQASNDVAVAVTAVATEAYKAYPFLQVGSEAADPDAIQVVLARRNALADGGMPLDEALQAAIDEKAPRFAQLNGATGTETVAARAARETREAAAMKKNADASIRQPVTPISSEKDASFKVDVEKLSDKEFAKLPASVKSNLRGDKV